MSNHDPTREIVVTAVPNSLTLHHIRHTPEPWVCEVMSAVYVMTDGGHTLAEMRGWGYLAERYGAKEAMEMQRANGMLMAAAPRLLSAVVAAVNLIIEKVSASDNEAQVVVKELIAAINLAVKGNLPSRPGDEKS